MYMDLQLVKDENILSILCLFSASSDRVGQEWREPLSPFLSFVINLCFTSDIEKGTKERGGKKSRNERKIKKDKRMG